MKYVLYRLMMPLLITFAAVNAVAADNKIIHRAVEPAQMLLDITLKEQSLTLFLTIPAISLPLLAPDGHQNNMTSLLTDSPNLWLTNPEAGCTLNSHRIFQGHTDDNLHPSGDVQGFYDFSCLKPKSLVSIRPDLQAALPGLKQLNIWLTTEHWQNKQSLTLPDNTIVIQPDL